MDGGSALEVDPNGVLVDDFAWPGGVQEHEFFDGTVWKQFWEGEEGSKKGRDRERDSTKWTTNSRFGAFRFELNITLLSKEVTAYRAATSRYMNRIKREADRRACFGWVQAVNYQGYNYEIGESCELLLCSSKVRKELICSFCPVRLSFPVTCFSSSPSHRQ